MRDFNFRSREIYGSNMRVDMDITENLMKGNGTCAWYKQHNTFMHCHDEFLGNKSQKLIKKPYNKCYSSFIVQHLYHNLNHGL